MERSAASHSRLIYHLMSIRRFDVRDEFLGQNRLCFDEFAKFSTGEGGHPESPFRGPNPCTVGSDLNPATAKFRHEHRGTNSASKTRANCLTTAQITAKVLGRCGLKSLSVSLIFSTRFESHWSLG